jgi:hypothetical protein
MSADGGGKAFRINKHLAKEISMSTTTLSLHQVRTAPLNIVQSLLQWESVLFAAICLTDMFSTLYWVHMGSATEANPMLARCLQQGDAVFCLTKLASFVPMLCLAAWYRLKQPKFIATALRLAIVAYIGIYVIAVGAEFIR